MTTKDANGTPADKRTAQLARARKMAAAQSDPHETAKEREQVVLRYIAKYGWLTASQLQIATDIKLRPLQRTLSRLRGNGEIGTHTLVDSTRRPAHKVPAYYLTGRGAARVVAETGYDAVSGGSIKYGEWVHRGMCNSFMLWLEAAGFQTWTEYEILRGVSPLAKSLHLSERRKIADGLAAQQTDDGLSYLWVEVENHHRGPNERRYLQSVVRNAVTADLHEGTPSYPGLRITELLLVGRSNTILRSSLETCNSEIHRLKREHWEDAQSRILWTMLSEPVGAKFDIDFANNAPMGSLLDCSEPGGGVQFPPGTESDDE